MVSVKELIDKINEMDNSIKELTTKNGVLAEHINSTYQSFASLLGLEIGKLHKLEPETLEIKILPNNKILVSAGRDGLFHLDFDNFNKQLEYLLCMVRLIGIEDGAAVASGTKSQAQVYHEVKQDFPDYQNQCKSCGKLLPPIDEEDDPSLANFCEACLQNGEY